VRQALSSNNQFDPSGEIELMRQRILDLEARNRQLELLAATDELTGLLNRRAFRSRLNQEVLRSARYGRCVALLYIDLDSLKTINDSGGHAEGDAILKLVAETIRGALRQTDVIARLGGDEFAAILPDADLQGAADAAERIRRTVAEANGSDDTITVSIGAAAYSNEISTAEELMLAADGQLYRAKALGGNTVCKP
jgi:diguanylate cyclase (GGDEF)-like protein